MPTPELALDEGYIAMLKARNAPKPVWLGTMATARVKIAAAIEADYKARGDAKRAEWRAASQAERNAMAKAEGRELRAYSHIAGLTYAQRAEHLKIKEREKKQRYRDKKRKINICEESI